MSEQNWKPGDLAVIRVPKKSAPGFAVTERGDVDVLVVATRTGFVALADPDYYWREGYAFHATNPRPLVVIDPESAEDVERLANAYRSVDNRVGTQPLQAALREFASPTPPKPDEPLTGGSQVREADGTVWTRVEGQPDKPWVYSGSDASYASLDVVEVLR